jgi:hypothetical protein
MPANGIIWSSNGSVNRTSHSNSLNTSAVLLESRNFELIGNQSNTMIWQSFDDPTDILLPGAKFGWNKITGLGSRGGGGGGALQKELL